MKCHCIVRIIAVVMVSNVILLCEGWNGQVLLLLYLQCVFKFSSFSSCSLVACKPFI